MAARFRFLPAQTGIRDRGLVEPVEQVDDPLIGREIGADGLVDQEADSCLVGILVEAGQPDRLQVGMTVASGAVGQKGIVPVGPEVRVEGVSPLLVTGLHDRAPTALQRTLQKRRQHLLERLALEMVEQHLRHHPPLLISSRTGSGPLAVATTPGARPGRTTPDRTSAATTMSEVSGMPYPS